MTTRHDLPTPDDTTVPYWEGTADHRLLLKRCQACGRNHFYPRPFCPHCWSDNVEWLEASGRATLYTYAIVRANGLEPFSSEVPYIAAVVDLEEGVRMMTNVVECPFEGLAIGMPLELAFRAAKEFSIPVFRPATPRPDVR
jgi:uncharacterized OB-fold protein